MAALRGGGAPWRRGWLPALQLVRHGSKAVTRHWKAMHFQRQKLMAVTEYLAPRPAIPPRCLAPRKEKVEEDNGYARLLRRQVEEVFRDNRMIAVCQYNSMPGEDMVLMKHYLRKHNIEVKFVLNEVGTELLGQIPLWLGWGKAHECWERPRGACWGGKLHFKSCLPQIIRPMLSQSKYKNLLPLFVARNILLVSPETKVKEMLRVLKGVPQINLLGACIDSTILSRQGVENFAKLPSLEASQGQMVGALALLPSQTSSLLQGGSAHLTALLDEHIRRLQAGEMGSPDESAPAQSLGAH
ncbi:PREDICTED: 39S ribosomal protein L10, mitochondrial isoform X1 [Haliaeetus leucocephalus]|uniref:39S ribosomal protein L10, mitochondrial isoform X1 n=1 Tax=Haliaeetus leucocephalus TaxID=52644 RepID=UPI00053CE352|nr:PREDICTED: 39S ribosomal protein L10, mitochondrial isoform X1 [Haliaeetus leucocephalus]